MSKKIKFNNNAPIYIQISNYFLAKVFVGELKPDDKIPSRRELGAELGVNLNTVQKSYVYMEDIGLIKTEKNRQSTITDDLVKIQSLKNDFLKEPLYEFIKIMKSINISKEKVIELIEESYDKVFEEEEENDKS
ncbi:GntR family transcriptional regulator [Peptostreptococcus faecalis]|uniref:GntR family transcriptional regulator n=1 Tax=Peptostreptococcus faecalis TaxID=2045015 RepID=UPI001FA8F158|nr:GntR family transcriptional regulator [Peptostreptococcus faecalis]